MAGGHIYQKRGRGPLHRSGLNLEGTVHCQCGDVGRALLFFSQMPEIRGLNIVGCEVYRLWGPTETVGDNIVGATDVADAGGELAQICQLPPDSFRLVKHLVTQPLAADCYDKLKACLQERLALAPGERLRRLERLPPSLGDMKPSQLYSLLETLYPAEVNQQIVREMFLKRLPLPVSVLCREWLKNHTLAEEACMADVHFHLQAEVTASAATVQSPADDASVSTSTDQLVTALQRTSLRRSAAPVCRHRPPTLRRPDRRPPTSRRPSGDFVDRWCRIHQRYGPEARNCLGRCTFTEDMAGNRHADQ
ncbi:hypothetical protein M514_03697 [Trichuris suis]|uniref:Uncharacterized protein n=1 Tax=Trichuris suis TaxID=68888 RepID=A0A085MDR1_9BILA|nr:hypothetical protein M513_03697 [Trichuris suis]KFD68681.1 hypothetical protein M514_03697 [Trichuris suis]